MIGHMKLHRLQEWLNFVSNEIHKGFSPLFNPTSLGSFPDKGRQGGVKRLGGISPKATETVFKERLAGRLNIAAQALAGKDYLMGKTFTVADAYLYTVLRWSPRFGFDPAPWPALKDYMERIAARPAVKAAMAEEGLQASRNRGEPRIIWGFT